jgi:hypothetical protein
MGLQPPVPMGRVPLARHPQETIEEAGILTGAALTAAPAE